MNDLEDEREIMMYLRHEAGHAFNYAYAALPGRRSGATCSARSAGRTATHYRPVPFSRQFVRHIAGWYAQKHPDEDFAETFAVWLTPRSRWRERYQGWGAMRKLRYVDRMARKLRATEPVRPQGAHRHHRRGDGDDGRGVLPRRRRGGSAGHRSSSRSTRDLTDIFLKRLQAPAKGARPAADLLAENRKAMSTR